MWIQWWQHCKWKCILITWGIANIVNFSWKTGRLLDAMLALLNKRNARDLENLPKRELVRAKKLFRGVFIREKKGNPPREGPRRSIKGFHEKGALFTFENDDGMPITIKVRGAHSSV